MPLIFQSDTLMSTQEAAAELGVTDGRIRQMLLAGELRGKKFGQWTWVILLSEIERIRKRVRKRARMVTYKGRTQCCAAWARELGISRERLRQRLNAYPLERAMNPPGPLDAR